MCDETILILTKGLKIGWGGRIRTCECRLQKPVPYRLATPQWLIMQEAFMPFALVIQHYFSLNILILFNMNKIKWEQIIAPNWIASESHPKRVTQTIQIDSESS